MSVPILLGNCEPRGVSGSPSAAAAVSVISVHSFSSSWLQPMLMSEVNGERGPGLWDRGGSAAGPTEQLEMTAQVGVVAVSVVSDRSSDTSLFWRKLGST